MAGASLGVFAFLEGGVGNALQLGGVIVEVPDVSPMQRIGIGFEMAGAERSESCQHGVDLGLPGDEGSEGLAVVLGAALHGGLLLEPYMLHVRRKTSGMNDHDITL